MKLPLYFGFFEKDFSTPHPEDMPIGVIGCHFAPDGGLILPERPGDLLVVDDSVLPSGSPEAACAALQTAFERYDGIVFDFERPLNGFCTALLTELSPPPDRFTVVPPAYAAVSAPSLVLVSGVLCNNWAAFCRRNQARWPDRWCLEVRPWNLTVPLPCAVPESYHRQAMCHMKADGSAYRVFDTGQTLRQKLSAAEEAGCQLAIGLYQDLREFF